MSQVVILNRASDRSCRFSLSRKFAPTGSIDQPAIPIALRRSSHTTDGLRLRSAKVTSTGSFSSRIAAMISGARVVRLRNRATSRSFTPSWRFARWISPCRRAASAARCGHGPGLPAGSLAPGVLVCRGGYAGRQQNLPISAVALDRDLDDHSHPAIDLFNHLYRVQGASGTAVLPSHNRSQYPSARHH